MRRIACLLVHESAAVPSRLARAARGRARPLATSGGRRRRSRVSRRHRAPRALWQRGAARPASRGGGGRARAGSPGGHRGQPDQRALRLPLARRASRSSSPRAMRRIWRRLRWRSSISLPRWRRGSTAGASARWASWPPCPPPRSSSASAVKGRACSSSRGARIPARSARGRRRRSSRRRRRSTMRWRRSGRSSSCWRRSPGGSADQLVRRGRSADQFEWVCHLADRRRHEGSCVPAVPLSERAAVTALLRASLEARPPRRRGGGGDAPGAAGAGPRRADVTGRSLAPEPAARHGDARPARRPGRRAADRRPRAARQPSPRRGRARALSCPRAAFVDERQRAGGGRSARRSPCAASARRFPPASRWSPAARSSSARGGSPRGSSSARGRGACRGSGGPSAPGSHDEWDVELGEGVICRLTQDGSAWWLDGIYD